MKKLSSFLRNHLHWAVRRPKIMLVLITAVGVLGMIFGFIVALRRKRHLVQQEFQVVRVLGLTVSALAIVFFSGASLAEAEVFR